LALLLVAPDYWFGFFFIPRKNRATEEISAITDSKLDIANQKSGYSRESNSRIERKI
jgi:hypothetical protein